MSKENLFSLIIIGLFLLFLGQCNKVYAYEYYSYSKELLKNENIYKMPPITVTPGYAQEWDMPKFSSPQNNNMQILKMKYLCITKKGMVTNSIFHLCLLMKFVAR